jgi:hypothetical protein
MLVPKDGGSVPQYFFTIHGREQVDDDPDGTYLPDVAAALSSSPLRNTPSSQRCYQSLA